MNNNNSNCNYKNDHNNKYNNNVTIQNITVLFSVILGTHYFLSYRWYYGMLKMWGIESLAVISLEDLIFPYAHLNIFVLAITSFGFIGIFLWHILITKDFDSNYNFMDSLKSKMFFFIKQKIWIKILLVILFTVIMILLYFKVVAPIISDPNWHLVIFLLGIIIGVPAVYIILPKKRYLIFGLQLILMFLWANLFINIILKDAFSKENKTKTNISFIYKNRRIESSNSLLFVHHGYKYLIMQDTVGNSILYPSKLIEEVTYNNDVN